VAGQGFEPWKASADGFIDRCRATGHRCTLKSPVDHALTGRAVARGLATSTGAVRPGWEGGGIPTTSRWVTTPHQGGRTPPRSESHIGSLDTARSGDDRKLLSQSTEVTSLASGVDHIPSHCRRMPRASTCKAISHATARLRSLIEKHLTSIQVLGERTQQPIRIRTINFHLLVEGAARMEGLSLGLVHGRPLPAGCVRRITLTCGFTSPVRSRTVFRTATDQKVGSSSLSGRAKTIIYTASDQRRYNRRRSNLIEQMDLVHRTVH
jgi:hypothetical protein